MILHTVVYGTPSLSLILALFRFFIKCRVKMANLCDYFALQCLWVLRASKLSLFAGTARFSLISEASFSSQYLQFSNSLPFLWCLDSLIHFSHRVYSDRVCLISGVTDSNPLPLCNLRIAAVLPHDTFLHYCWFTLCFIFIYTRWTK